MPTLTDLFGEALLKCKFTRENNKNTFNNNDRTSLNFQNNVYTAQQQQSGQSIRRKRQREQISPVLQKNFTNKFENTSFINLRRQRAFTGPLNVDSLLHKENANNNIINQNQRQSIVRFADLENERTSSMMSHTTFVLENNQHKPLLVSSGFIEGNFCL